jgi:hypothetical protein
MPFGPFSFTLWLASVFIHRFGDFLQLSGEVLEVIEQSGWVFVLIQLLLFIRVLWAAGVIVRWFFWW